MVYFNYKQYLSSIILNPLSASEDRANAVEELKRRADLRAIGSVLMLLSLSATLVAAITDLCVVASREHATTMESSGNLPWQAVAGAVAAILWSMAWFSVGSISGFLFGIPKISQSNNVTISASSQPTGPGHQYQQQVNTNLEQISDWLTKIIVGLGLVQLRQVPGYISKAAAYMASDRCGVACDSLATAILLCGLVLGFLTGYLLTRMFLAPAFGRADQGSQGNPVQTITRQPVGPGSEQSRITDPTARADSPVRAAIASVSSMPTTSDAPFEQKWAQAKAKLLQQDYPGAVRDYAQLVAANPNNVTVRLEFIWALFKQAGSKWTALIQDQLQYAYRLRHETGSPLQKQLFEALTYYPLYNEPTGSDDVIRFAQEYVQDKHNDPDAEIFLNLACAYGQKYKSEQKVEWRAAALSAAKQAISIDPRTADILRYQLQGNDPNENDLNAFSEDQEFRSLLNLPPIEKAKNTNSGSA